MSASAARPTTPLNGERTHPLSATALSVLEDIRRAPVPCQDINPGVVNRLRREPMVELVDLPSPYDSARGRRVPHLRFKAANLELIRETIAQDWPRCGGERIDGAEVWVRQWTDAEVIAWLEVGVYTAAAAIRLACAGVEPREVGGEYETDVTLGLAFARGDVSVDRVLERRRPARGDRS